MEIMMFLSFLLWAAPLAGGFYLVLRFIRAFESRGAGRREVEDLRQHVQALEESLDHATGEIDRLATAQDFTTRLLSERTGSPS